MQAKPLSLQLIKSASAAFTPMDPVLAEMLPPETAELAVSAKTYIDWLVTHLESTQRELSELRSALALYSKDCKDELFDNNLALCMQQVKLNRK